VLVLITDLLILDGCRYPYRVYVKSIYPLGVCFKDYFPGSLVWCRRA